MSAYPNPRQLHGYGSGSYSCRCSKCGQEHIADKRAVTCLSCARQQEIDCLKTQVGMLRNAAIVTLAELAEDDEGIEIGDLDHILDANRAALAATEPKP